MKPFPHADDGAGGDISLMLIRRLDWLLLNPYLLAIRDGLTYALPVIVAGTLGLLINTLPWPAYQTFMEGVFGMNWTAFGRYAQQGTLGVLALMMCLSISYSLADSFNSQNPDRAINPVLVSMTSLAAFLCTIEPEGVGPGVLSRWLSVYGILWATLCAMSAGFVFRRLTLLRPPRLGAGRGPIAQSVGALLPGLVVILAFTLFKVSLQALGVPDINGAIYNLVYTPFYHMGGGSLETAGVFDISKQLLWFFGIHGSNVMEPVMTELYLPNIAKNQAALALEQMPTHIFTKPFFDCFTSIGGSGSTLGLLLAVLWKHEDADARKIAKISILPAILNVNEIMLFGLPVVLNPVFLVPFVLVPLMQTAAGYLAIAVGLAPATINVVAWNSPVLLNGYSATGSIAGIFLQLFCLAISVFIYLPFVLLDRRLKCDRALADAEEAGDNVRRARPQAAKPGNAAELLAKSLADDLKNALDSDEICLEYQPQLDSETGRVVGMEALMRWRHPRIGRVPPTVFVDLAEESGFIDRLGFWALREAIRQNALWAGRGHPNLMIAVNISARQLAFPQWPARVMTLLREEGMPAVNLRLEVAESALAASPGMGPVLKRLTDEGVKLVIDDFGLAGSSMNFQKRFQVEAFKLHSSLSRDVLTSHSSGEVIASIAELCRGLGIGLIAKHVETEEQLLKLRTLGCREVQGFFYSPPLPVGETLSFISSGHRAFRYFGADVSEKRNEAGESLGDLLDGADEAGESPDNLLDDAES